MFSLYVYSNSVTKQKENFHCIRHDRLYWKIHIGIWNANICGATRNWPEEEGGEVRWLFLVVPSFALELRMLFFVAIVGDWSISPTYNSNKTLLLKRFENQKIISWRFPARSSSRQQRTSSPPGWSVKKFVTSYACFGKNQNRSLKFRNRRKARNVICAEFRSFFNTYIALTWNPVILSLCISLNSEGKTKWTELAMYFQKVSWFHFSIITPNHSSTKWFSY